MIETSYRPVRGYNLVYPLWAAKDL